MPIKVSPGGHDVDSMVHPKSRLFSNYLKHVAERRGGLTCPVPVESIPNRLTREPSSQPDAAPPGLESENGNVHATKYHVGLGKAASFVIAEDETAFPEDVSVSVSTVTPSTESNSSSQSPTSKGGYTDTSPSACGSSPRLSKISILKEDIKARPADAGKEDAAPPPHFDGKDGALLAKRPHADGRYCFSEDTVIKRMELHDSPAVTRYPMDSRYTKPDILASMPSTPGRVRKAAAAKPIKPSVMTVELAAAAKIYLETYYNELLCRPPPRQLRTHHLEHRLYLARELTPAIRQEYRKAFYRAESNQLRETRVLKAKCTKDLLYGDIGGRSTHSATMNATDYETIRILGKGSFGTVRLVREKPKLHDDPSVIAAKRKQVYAMKIIRKLEMLRSGQEGHLRAERDFLVASEGSNW